VLVLGLGRGRLFLLLQRLAISHQKDGQCARLPSRGAPGRVLRHARHRREHSVADGSPAYLKLSVSLELDNAEEKPGIQVLMPRVVDQFQSYLRELRIDDLHGSAGVMRLKEELLRRINVAAAPFPVRDVLLKEMIVQ
jgi:hypothetical protein